MPSQAPENKKGTSMFCSECGKQIEDSALFCPECGAKVEQQPYQPAANEGATGSEASNAFSDSANTFKSVSKTKQYGIIVASTVAALLIIIVAAVILIAPQSSQVSTDTARQAFAQSSLATKGAISSKYVGESAYELKEFDIDKQEDAPANRTQQVAKTTHSTNQAKTVYFSGTIANNSFETDFTGQCDFANINGNWSPVSSSSLKINSKNTKPLKGVDSLDQSNSSNNVNYSDFSSDLKESNGTYTSNATSTIAYKYWFATDIAKVTQAFTFDPNSGWKASGEPTTSNQSTEWNLKDRTFKYAGSTGFKFGSGVSAITFGEVTDGNASASYVFEYTPNAGASDGYVTYHAISLKGTATGKPTHEFGTENFTIQLSDSSQSVDITCEANRFTQSSGESNTIAVSMDTKSAYATYRNGTASNLGLSGRNCSEVAQTNA